LLARSRQITLAGADIETPLLVPAISSKALGPISLGRTSRRKDTVVPASYVHTETFVRGMDQAVLISAYDIHHKLIANAEALRSGFENSLYAGPRLLIIDNGWYEKSVGPESGQWYYDAGGQGLEFGEDDYIALVDNLDPNVAALVVAWDRVEDDRKYDSQIEMAQDFFGNRKRFSAEILLKPQGTRRFHDFRDLSASTAARLRAFDVVGVTEKELGDTVTKRLVSLAQLRMCLDGAKAQQPIHVFGGLDPLATPLYFAAGAEIFDGLTWLRYAFWDGRSIYREATPILTRQYDKRFAVAVADTQLKNLDALAELTRELKVWLHNDMDWSKLRNGELLQPAFEAMESAIGMHNGR